MNILAITQARYSSTRLPGKVLEKLGSGTVLELHLRRILKSKYLDRLVVATTLEPESTRITELASSLGVSSFRGSLEDVLARFYETATSVAPEPPKYIVRLTSDCPLIDPSLIDELIEKFLSSGADYGSNCLNPTLPDGMDAEIFTFTALQEAWEKANKKSQREHVTPYIRDCGHFKMFSLEYPNDLSAFRLTLDTAEDLVVLRKLVDGCGEEAMMEEYVQFLEAHPEVKKINSDRIRNEGYLKSLRNDEV